MSAEKSRAYEHLHKLLQELQDAEDELAHGPKRVAAAKRKVEAARQACAEQKDQIQTLKKKADQNSLSLKSREAELEKLSVRLNQASSNKEYDIIQTQISTEKAADAELEDSILTLLSDVDDANASLASLEDTLAAAESRAEEITAEVSQREPDLKAEIERLNSEVREAEKIIPTGVPTSTYKRLRGTHRASSMARTDDGYCLECNTGATQQDVVRLNLGEFVLCRACGRILYQVRDDDGA